MNLGLLTPSARFRSTWRLTSPGTALAGSTGRVGRPIRWAIHTLPLATTPEEPSGSDVDRTFPHGPVTDDPNMLTQFINELFRHLPCADPRSPSEFRRPWLRPDHNNDGTPTKTEGSAADHGFNTGASPYVKLQDGGLISAILANTKPGMRVQVVQVGEQARLVMQVMAPTLRLDPRVKRHCFVSGTRLVCKSKDETSDG
jgi:hypothetical protein